MSGQEWMTTAVMLICAGTDLYNRKVYRWIVLLYLTMAAMGRLATGTDGDLQVLAVDLLPGFFCLLLAWATRQEIGYGDVMLILGCGLSVGWSACMEMVVSALFLAGVVALLMLIRHRGRKKELSFVPFLLAAWAWHLICGT